MTNQSTVECDHGGLELLIWQPIIQQQLFKGLMQSFSYPGRVTQVNHKHPIYCALATMVDQGIALSDPDGLLEELFVRRLGCKLAPPESSTFVVCNGNNAPNFTPQLGSLEAPETGATVIIAVSSLDSGKRYQLRGPGIQDTQLLQVDGIDSAWLKAHQGWRSHYPMGVDFLLVSHNSWVALPRTLTILKEIS